MLEAAQVFPSLGAEMCKRPHHVLELGVKLAMSLIILEM
jgi:hypothetical protein